MRAVPLGYSVQPLNRFQTQAPSVREDPYVPFMDYVWNIQSQPLDLSSKKDNRSSGDKPQLANRTFLTKLQTARNAGFRRRCREKANFTDYLHYLKARKTLNAAYEQAYKTSIFCIANLMYPGNSHRDIDLTGFCYTLIDGIKKRQIFVPGDNLQQDTAKFIRAMAFVTINVENRTSEPRWK